MIFLIFFWLSCCFSLKYFSPKDSLTLRAIESVRSEKTINTNEDSPHVPTIGVLSQPSSWVSLYPPDEFSYIAASYIKALEAAGAKVVPIKFDWSDEKLKEVFKGINGLLLPGGGTELTEIIDGKTKFTSFGEILKKIIKMAIDINEKNEEYFPVWGTCLGFESLVLSISEDLNILQNFSSLNYSNVLNFVEGSQMSRMFHDLNPEAQWSLSYDNLTYFNHKYALDTNLFQKNENLSNFFNPLTVTYDKSNREFVSSFESKKYPIYGVQFHPEKNAYEWKLHLQINHSPTAIQTLRHFMDFFVKETSKSQRRFENKTEERSLLIYNFYPLQMSDSFQLVYMFTRKDKPDIFRTIPTHTSLFMDRFTGNSTENGQKIEKKEKETIKNEDFGFLKKIKK